MFRVHGADTDTELWHLGDQTMSDVLESAIQPRYRLLPYTYSGFQRVEAEGQGLTLVHFSAQRKHFLWTIDVHFSE